MGYQTLDLWVWSLSIYWMLHQEEDFRTKNFAFSTSTDKVQNMLINLNFWPLFHSPWVSWKFTPYEDFNSWLSKPLGIKFILLCSVLDFFQKSISPKWVSQSIKKGNCHLVVKNWTKKLIYLSLWSIIPAKNITGHPLASNFSQIASALTE